jgi:hypothetical protein
MVYKPTYSYNLWAVEIYWYYLYIGAVIFQCFTTEFQILFSILMNFHKYIPLWYIEYMILISV